MQIQIAGKELNLTFGLHLGEMLMQEASGKQRIGTINFMAMLLFYAHENWCLGHDANPVLTKGQIFSYLEENNADAMLAVELQKVLQAYTDSKPAQAINAAAATEGKKKEPAIVKSEPSPSES